MPQHMNICFWLLVEKRKDKNPVYPSHLSTSTLRHHTKEEEELT